MSTDEPSAKRLRAADADRDRVIQVVRRAHEAGRLRESEMLERTDVARRAVHLDELPELVADLPEDEGWPLLPTSAGVDNLPAPRPAADLANQHSELVPAHGPTDGGFSASVMSGRDIAVAQGTEVMSNFAFWGGNNYDLTRAMGPGRTVVLNLSAVMAGSDIKVPRGVRVVDQSLAIMASNTIKPKAQGDGSNGTLVLKGFLFWAGNTVALARGQD